MTGFSFLTSLAVVALALVTPSLAALGPQSNLHIENGNLSPDGFNRLAVLAEGTFPGPLIQANKASHVFFAYYFHV